jgi:predicted transcriptional regulator
MKLKSEFPTEVVVLSFDARWHRLLLDSSPSVVFRRRVPRHDVKKLFLYVNSPVGSIVGLAHINRLEVISCSDALETVANSGLSRSELATYVGERESVGVFHLRNVIQFSKPIPREFLQEQCDLSPPQNYTYLDPKAADQLEHLFR